MRPDDVRYPRTVPDNEMLLACVDLIASQEGLSGSGNKGMKRRRITLEAAVREARARSATRQRLILTPDP